MVVGMVQSGFTIYVVLDPRHSLGIVLTVVGAYITVDILKTFLLHATLTCLLAVSCDTLLRLLLLRPEIHSLLFI